MSEGTVQKMFALEGVSVFSQSDVDDIAAVAAVAREVRFRAGERIFSQGDPGDALYVIVEGAVDHFRDGEHVLRSQAKETFGDVSLLDGAPRPTDVVAVEDTRVLVIDRRDFLDLLADRPELLTGFFRAVSQQLRDPHRSAGHPPERRAARGGATRRARAPRRPPAKSLSTSRERAARPVGAVGPQDFGRGRGRRGRGRGGLRLRVPVRDAPRDEQVRGGHRDERAQEALHQRDHRQRPRHREPGEGPGLLLHLRPPGGRQSGCGSSRSGPSAGESPSGGPARFVVSQVQPRRNHGGLASLSRHA